MVIYAQHFQTQPFTHLKWPGFFGAKNRLGLVCAPIGEVPWQCPLEGEASARAGPSDTTRGGSALFLGGKHQENAGKMLENGGEMLGNL